MLIDEHISFPLSLTLMYSENEHLYQIYKLMICQNTTERKITRLYQNDMKFQTMYIILINGSQLCALFLQ